MKNTMLISAFAGTGKTTLCNTEFASLEVLDLDSSTFSKCENFPVNYAESIQDSMGQYDIILISTHDAVREELLRRDVPFFIVYPDPSAKEAYRERYKERGSSPAFVECIMNSWDAWIKTIEEDSRLSKLKISSKEYLSQVIPLLSEYHEARFQTYSQYL